MLVPRQPLARQVSETTPDLYFANLYVRNLLVEAPECGRTLAYLTLVLLLCSVLLIASRRTHYCKHQIYIGKILIMFNLPSASRTRLGALDLQRDTQTQLSCHHLVASI